MSLAKDTLTSPVSFWFQCLVDDDRTIRMVSFQALECVLKICKVKRKRVYIQTQEMFDNKNTDSVLKNGHADKSDFSEKKKSENGNGLHESDENVLPGIRPDNLWLQYKSQMTDEELSSYWDKPFSVKTGSGFYAWSKPTIKLHVTGMFVYIINHYI